MHVKFSTIKINLKKNYNYILYWLGIFDNQIHEILNISIPDHLCISSNIIDKKEIPERRLASKK